MLYLFSEAKQFLYEKVLQNQYCCDHCKKYFNAKKHKPIYKESIREEYDNIGFFRAKVRIKYLQCPKRKSLNEIDYTILKSIYCDEDLIDID